MAKVEPKVIFKDDKILVLDKPAGLPVTRTKTTNLPTLQDWLGRFLQLGKSLGIGGRAGIVHRLDSDTSGLVIIAKTPDAFEFLQQQFAKRQVFKKYLTLVHGIPNLDTFQVNLAIGRRKFGKFGVKIEGREAVTSFVLLEKFQFGEKFGQILAQFPKNLARYLAIRAKFYSLLEAQPTTGRTHQIRVHASFSQLPIVSDTLYLPRKLLKFDAKFCPRLFLHAAVIEFTHPNKNRVKFESALPVDLKRSLKFLKSFG